MSWDYYEYRIAEHFIFVLEYGDYGDMSEEEIKEIQSTIDILK